MKMMIGFASFVVYGILVTTAGFTAAAVVAALLGLGAPVYGLATGSTDQLTVTSTAVYGVYAALALLGDVSKTVEGYSAGLALGVITVVIATGLVTGHPFTEAFARQSVPTSPWGSPIFRKINIGITTAWLAAFAAMAAVNVAKGAGVALPLPVVLTVGPIVAALIFTKRYPDMVTGRSNAPRPAAV